MQLKFTFDDQTIEEYNFKDFDEVSQFVHEQQDKLIQVKVMEVLIETSNNY